MTPVTPARTAAALIDRLSLSPHPEGGHFREVFRSGINVQLADRRGHRSALTTIYYLLCAGEVSRWHRVASDEAWHFYEGDPLELLIADAEFTRVERRLLGNTSDTAQPVHVVAAGCWQAARSTGAYTLAGCSVGPGFDFADFEMLRDQPDAADRVRQRHRDVEGFI